MACALIPCLEQDDALLVLGQLCPAPIKHLFANAAMQLPPADPALGSGTRVARARLGTAAAPVGGNSSEWFPMLRSQRCLKKGGYLLQCVGPHAKHISCMGSAILHHSCHTREYGMEDCSEANKLTPPAGSILVDQRWILTGVLTLLISSTVWGQSTSKRVGSQSPVQWRPPHWLHTMRRLPSDDSGPHVRLVLCYHE